jgi:hypothetical protein
MVQEALWRDKRLETSQETFAITIYSLERSPVLHARFRFDFPAVVQL